MLIGVRHYTTNSAKKSFVVDSFQIGDIFLCVYIYIYIAARLHEMPRIEWVAR
jgi:hypothetical protein